MTQGATTFPYRDYIEQAWNAHDLAAFDRYMAMDVRIHSHTPGAETGVGLEHLKSLAQMLYNGFPDARFELLDVVAQGEQLAARLWLEGTHRGEFAGMPPTGKHMRVVDFALYRISNGKITDVWSVVDMLGMREQLGFSN